jgi:hypothetical protein
VNHSEYQRPGRDPFYLEVFGEGMGPERRQGQGVTADGAPGKVTTTVLHVGGVGWASEKAVVERVLGRRPGSSST